MNPYAPHPPEMQACNSCSECKPKFLDGYWKGSVMTLTMSLFAVTFGGLLREAATMSRFGEAVIWIVTISLFCMFPLGIWKLVEIVAWLGNRH